MTARRSDNAPGVGARRAKLFATAFFIALAGLPVTSLTTAIWPGAAKLTAPLFCHASDLGGSYTPIVVADTHYYAGRTTVNFTLYCVGPRGELLDVGFGRPMLVIFAFAVAVVAVLAMAVLHRRRVRRRRNLALAGNEWELPYRLTSHRPRP